MALTPAEFVLKLLEPLLKPAIYALLVMVGLQLMGIDAFGIVFGWVESIVIDWFGQSLVDEFTNWVDGVVPW